MVSNAAETQKEQVCGASIRLSEDKVVYLAREALEEWWRRVPDWSGWRNGWRRGNGWGDTFFSRDLATKEKRGISGGRRRIWGQGRIHFQEGR